ncbi:hypothetical protein [Nesterenkonia marinintestina]|uniref:hypothetical protein n=1 Tax=Nesterenkonia marinintestina TaxID=2979865 RepID=UPI0021BE66F5|nr:hypothetical protein [Nesterenkonia sp. GX14115]
MDHYARTLRRAVAHGREAVHWQGHVTQLQETLDTEQLLKLQDHESVDLAQRSSLEAIVQAWDPEAPPQETIAACGTWRRLKTEFDYAATPIEIAGDSVDGYDRAAPIRDAVMEVMTDQQRNEHMINELRWKDRIRQGDATALDDRAMLAWRDGAAPMVDAAAFAPPRERETTMDPDRMAHQLRITFPGEEPREFAHATEAMDYVAQRSWNKSSSRFGPQPTEIAWATPAEVRHPELAGANGDRSQLPKVVDGDEQISHNPVQGLALQLQDYRRRHEIQGAIIVESPVNADARWSDRMEITGGAGRLVGEDDGVELIEADLFDSSDGPARWIAIAEAFGSPEDLRALHANRVEAAEESLVRARTAYAAHAASTSPQAAGTSSSDVEQIAAQQSLDQSIYGHGPQAGGQGPEMD